MIISLIILSGSIIYLWYKAQIKCAKYKSRLIIHRKNPPSGGSGRSGTFFAEYQDYPDWELYDENPE